MTQTKIPAGQLVAATTSVAGTMSAAEWTKLDAIAAGSQVNVLEGVTGTAPIVAGAIAAKSQAISISAATTGAAGSMSSADKTKLDLFTGMAMLYDSGILGADTANMDSLAIIPGTYINLRVVLSLRADTADTYDYCTMIVNNDTGNNYDYVMPRFYHNAQYATSEELGIAYMIVGFPAAANSVAGDFSKITVDIPDYANANINKDFLGFSGWRGSASTGLLRLYNCYGHWRSTAAITRISVAPLTAGKKWKQYSRMTIYGY